jgi:hypothetical protein
VRSIRPRRKLRDANAKGIADLAADISFSQQTRLLLPNSSSPCTACIGDGLLPHSGNDLTLVFELRLIDLAAGEALG